MIDQKKHTHYIFRKQINGQIRNDRYPHIGCSSFSSLNIAVCGYRSTKWGYAGQVSED